MAISQGSMNAMFFIQDYILSPMRFTPDRTKLRTDSAYFNGSKSQAQHILQFTKASLKTLVGHWEEGNNLEQICVNALFLTLFCIGWSAFDTIENAAEDLSFVVTQLLVLAKFKPVGYPSFSRMPNFMEASVYMVSFCFATLPLMAFATPFTLDYHMLKIVVKWVLQHLGGVIIIPKYELV